MRTSFLFRNGSIASSQIPCIEAGKTKMGCARKSICSPTTAHRTEENANEE